MKRLRGGSGLGDSIYLRPIVDKLIRDGEQVVVCSNYPDVFVGSGANVEDFRRDKIDIVAHYTTGKSNLQTNQWQDVCNSARVQTELKFNWKIKNKELIKNLLLKSSGKKIIMVHGGRHPMGRTDGFGMELLPDRIFFDNVLCNFEKYFTVLVGRGNQIYTPKVDLNLTGQTTISDILDIAKISSAVIAQCSFAIPLAECFDKPLLALWGASATNSNQAYVKTITPKKILSKKTSKYIFDDCDEKKIKEIANAFCEF